MPGASPDSDRGGDPSAGGGPADREAERGLRDLDVRSIGRAGSVAAWTASAAAGTGALTLAGSGDRTALTAAILLGVVALVALAVGVQATGEPWPGERGYGAEEGTEREPEEPRRAGAPVRRLPLADRLALGLAGGAAGGIVVAGAVWLTDAAGIADLLGVRISGVVTGEALAMRAWYGGLWGVVLGVLYPRLPGRSAVSRCTLFGLAPALYALLLLYPLVLDLGWLAVDLGALTALPVVLLHLLWGAAVGVFFRWGETADVGVLSRPLVGR